MIVKDNIPCYLYQIYKYSKCWTLATLVIILLMIEFFLSQLKVC